MSAEYTVRRVSTAEAPDLLSLVEEYYDAVHVVARDDIMRKRLPLLV